MGFLGYKRPDGKCGVRNHVMVLASVSCANGVVNAIGRELPEVKAVTHPEGCGRGIADVEITGRTVAGLCKNPNVASILIVGLGCEFMKAPQLAEQAQASGKRVESLVIQEQGGTRKTTAKGIEIARDMLAEAGSLTREECGWDKLVLGLECGGSDALSGVTANSLVGVAADWLVAQGGTVILSETTEMIGTEEVLRKRAATPEIGEKLYGMIKDHTSIREGSPGTFRQHGHFTGQHGGRAHQHHGKIPGLHHQGGTTPVVEVVDYGVEPSVRRPRAHGHAGLGYLLFDRHAAAGGAQIMLFTTGGGRPSASPIVTRHQSRVQQRVFEMMNDDMDVNAGRLLEGVSIADAGEELIDLIKRVAEGEPPKAEINLQDCLSIHTVGPAF